MDVSTPPSELHKTCGGCPLLRHSKKKGCKGSKCSNYKGGRCRCGRD